MSLSSVARGSKGGWFSRKIEEHTEEESSVETSFYEESSVDEELSEVVDDNKSSEVADDNKSFTGENDEWMSFERAGDRESLTRANGEDADSERLLNETISDGSRTDSVADDNSYVK